MIHNTNNKNTLRKRLPAGAAVTLLGATVVAGIQRKLLYYLHNVNLR